MRDLPSTPPRPFAYDLFARLPDQGEHYTWLARLHHFDLYYVLTFSWSGGQWRRQHTKEADPVLAAAIVESGL